MSKTIDPKTIDALIAKERDGFLKDYKRIVEIPTVSCQPEHKKDVEEGAKVAAELLKQAGAEVKIYSTKGNPVVFGRITNKPGAKTLAIYNHMDVQPVEPKGQGGWEREPFEFSEENGRFWSRGTTDDKGPGMTALWAAKMARNFEIPLNLEFIWEFEEEIGSPNFEEFLEKAKSDIKADTIVVSDTVWLAQGKPAISRALRGLLAMLWKVRTGKKDVHSGLCGGAARNPVTELCWMISQCVDGMTGEITIPGIEKTWTPPTQKELADLVESGFSLENWVKSHELEKIRTTNAADTISRIWTSPTFEVHGFSGAYHGAGVKTVVPGFAEAKISMRLVGDQDPDVVFDLVKKYVEKLNPDCTVEKEGVLRPYTAPRDLPEFDAAKEAIEFGFGVRPVFNIEGGSIGAVVSMAEILKRPIVLLGLSLPNDGYHCPNESFAWEQIQGGVKAFIKYFEILSR